MFPGPFGRSAWARVDLPCRACRRRAQAVALLTTQSRRLATTSPPWRGACYCRSGCAGPAVMAGHVCGICPVPLDVASRCLGSPESLFSDEIGDLEFDTTSGRGPGRQGVPGENRLPCWGSCTRRRCTRVGGDMAAISCCSPYHVLSVLQVYYPAIRALRHNPSTPLLIACKYPDSFRASQTLMAELCVRRRGSTISSWE